MFIKFIERLHPHDQHLLNLLERKKAFTQEKISTLTEYVCKTNMKAVSLQSNAMAAVK